MKIMEKNWKYYLGMTLFLYSWLPYVAAGALLLFAIPIKEFVGIMAVFIASAEISFVISIFFLGKTFVKMLKEKVLGIFFRHKAVQPVKPISKLRHYIGVTLLLLSFVPCFVIEILLLFGYPKTDGGHLYMFISVILGYTIFILSLFVLGSDFWEHAKKLFIWPGDVK